MIAPPERTTLPPPAVQAEQIEFLHSLKRVETRAFLPLKWALLLTSIVHWVLSHPLQWLPPVEVFSLFVLYFMSILGGMYLFLLDRVDTPQIRPACIASYAFDVLFVTALVYFNASLSRDLSGSTADFYAFYLILILRSFALFRTPRENLVANSLVGIVFVISLLWQEDALTGPGSRDTMVRILFLWLVVLMSWFIVETLNNQKAELQRVREELVRQENLAVIGELAAGVAHEINNPVAIISAYAEFMERRTPVDDPNHEDLGAIRREAERCTTIVKELLNYARPATDQRAPVDLAHVTDEVIDFIVRSSPAAPVSLVKGYDLSTPPVSADRNQIKQALLNFLLNSREAMTDRPGEIRVLLRPADGGDGAEIRIEDDGCGMTPSQIRHAFDPFYTTRARGTGLGLSISRRIVEAHGGRVTLESTQGVGTTVTIKLPKLDAPDEEIPDAT